MRQEFDCNNKSRTLNNSSAEKLAGAGHTTGQDEEMTGDCVQIIETKDDAATRMKMDPQIPVTEYNDGGKHQNNESNSEDTIKHEATIHSDT